MSISGTGHQVPLALSTSWNSSRHTSGEQMLAEISALGFDHVELGHGIRNSLWEGIERFLGTNPMKVTSLRNFSPLPYENNEIFPEPWDFTAGCAEKRAQAQKLSMRTVEFARKIGAGFVVMHLGSVQMPLFTEVLCKQIQEGRYLDRSYVSRKLQAIQKREASSDYDRIVEWLKPIVDCATAAGVTIAIEIRSGIETFPSERELRRLFTDIASIGYWHDSGHAQIRHNLTLADHAEWLSEMSPRLVGCHIHDVIFPCSAYQLPFKGMIDFSALLSSVPSSIPLVWELSPQTSGHAIAGALALWRERFVSRERCSAG
ncbi:MAG: hypothetical protein C5B58_15835 [Acidobacteria bacterium]|nr:MAG: hypothetical protein C5B58_15835 [Acidobacteriota bacterium]